MSSSRSNRREFLKTSAGAVAAGVITPYVFTSAAKAQQSPNDRFVVGCIGTGDRWQGAIGPPVKRHGDIVAVCDADKARAEGNGQRIAGTSASGQTATIYEDYRKILDRKDIQIVTIATPDHWHSKILIEAMQAGKDVYCEKPMTLTIDEGKQICKVAKETNRVVQVGTQQRTEFNGPIGGSGMRGGMATGLSSPARFMTALAMVLDGRIGKLQKVQVAIGGADRGNKVPVAPVPAGLNWDLWQGQTPAVDYMSAGPTRVNGSMQPQGRTHYMFRWWYEYSGGKMTDWGAHHMDIAQWAILGDKVLTSGPLSLEGTSTHPVPLKDGMPTELDRYNCATQFNIKIKYPGDVELTLRHDTTNGITFTGDKGEIMVRREGLTGAAVDALRDQPLPEDAINKLIKGKKPGSHMDNFIACVKDRQLPASDVFTHHRILTTCHLANICIRLGRAIKWDAEKEQIVGDDDANKWLKREQRKGYEIVA